MRPGLQSRKLLVSLRTTASSSLAPSDFTDPLLSTFAESIKYLRSTSKGMILL